MTVKGTDIIYLFALEDEPAGSWKIGWQTEGETNETREYETTQTKDGVNKTAGGYEAGHTITALLGKNDSYIKKLKKTVRKPKGIKIWAIDRSDIDGGDTIPGEFSHNVISDITTSSGSDDSVEVSIEAEVAKGTIVDGDVTVTTELAEMLKDATEAIEFEQPTSGV